MTTSEKLRSTLESLPTLDERLHTWQRLIKELDAKERERISICINDLESNSELKTLAYNSTYIKISIELYEKLFKELVDRLRIPLESYNERIEQISGAEFRIKAKQFRIDEDLRCKARALELAANCLRDYRQGSVWDYIKTQETAVNGWHFTPGIMNYSNDVERKISYEEFAGFNPDGYAAEFSAELRRLFKNSGLI